MTPLHSQILTARDRNGQELRTIQKQLQKLPPGKLICSRNGTTVKWYQGDGHSKTYIPKANRTLAEQLALKSICSNMSKYSCRSRQQSLPI